MEVNLPSADEWEAALHPKAVQVAPTGIVTTDMDPDTYTAPTQWPGKT
jgi:hypothetical protein